MLVLLVILSIMGIPINLPGLLLIDLGENVTGYMSIRFRERDSCKGQEITKTSNTNNAK